EIFFKTYTEKVWGIPCTEIRAEWASQRIQGLSLEKALLNAVALNKRSDDIKSLIHQFRYPRLGPGQMWEACTARIEAMGNQVLRRHLVTQVEMTAGRATAVHASTPDGPTRIAADHVISTTDLRTLVGAITPSVAPPVAAAADGLRYRDFVTVAVIID